MISERPTLMNIPDLKAVLENAECLYSKVEVEAALDKLAAELNAAYKDAHLLILCVMIGALIPLGQLVTRLHFPLEVDYIHATRYGNAKQGGELKWLVKPGTSLKDRQVLIFDDIMDGGLTLAEIMNYCREAGVKEVKSAVMVNKLRTREAGVNLEPDFIGLNTPDRFLFGFGLDYEGYLRNLPEIYAIKE